MKRLSLFVVLATVVLIPRLFGDYQEIGCYRIAAGPQCTDPVVTLTGPCPSPDPGDSGAAATCNNYGTWVSYQAYQTIVGSGNTKNPTLGNVTCRKRWTCQWGFDAQAGVNCCQQVIEAVIPAENAYKSATQTCPPQGGGGGGGGWN